MLIEFTKAPTGQDLLGIKVFKINNKLFWEDGEDESQEPIKSYLSNAKFLYYAGKYKYVKSNNNLC